MASGFYTRINRVDGADAGAAILPDVDPALLDTTGSVTQASLETLLSGAGISSLKVSLNGTVYRIMLLANA